jgi:hypothetical protein
VILELVIASVVVPETGIAIGRGIVTQIRLTAIAPSVKRMLASRSGAGMLAARTPAIQEHLPFENTHATVGARNTPLSRRRGNTGGMTSGSRGPVRGREREDHY